MARSRPLGRPHARPGWSSDSGWSPHLGRHDGVIDMVGSANKLKVTLRRSVIGRTPKHRVIVRSLGLRRMHQTVVHPDRPEVRGMIRKVAYLLDVEEQVQ